jgi:hypothetical protein
MASSERTEMRKVFFECFRKYQEKLPLEPVEIQLVDIILAHPEYHSFLTNPEHIETEEFIEQNPFLHISLHLALREQINTNRPPGIAGIYQALCKKLNDTSAAEHLMMDCLAQTMWEAQQAGLPPDESIYWDNLNQLTTI